MHLEDDGKHGLLSDSAQMMSLLPRSRYKAATQSISMSNGPGQAGTLTKIRAGGSLGK
jgi:hypothetical protein